MLETKGLKHGDITEWATKVLHDGLEAVINSKASRRTPYFILVIIKNGYDGPATKSDNYLLHGKDQRQTDTETVDMSKKRVVTNRFVILDKAPLIPMIGSSLWRIDNKTGEVRCVYILPPDKPMVPGFEVGGKAVESETVAKCSKGMPIIYGAN